MCRGGIGAQRRTTSDNQDVAEFELDTLPFRDFLQVGQLDTARFECIMFVDLFTLGFAPGVVVEQNAPAYDALLGPFANAVYVAFLWTVDVV